MLPKPLSPAGKIKGVTPGVLEGRPLPFLAGNPPGWTQEALGVSFHPGVQSVQPELTLPTLRAQGRHPRIPHNGILSGIKVI